MSVTRKELVIKLDPDVHEAFCAICERDDMAFGQMGERLIEEFTVKEMHKFSLSKRKFADLRILKKISE